MTFNVLILQLSRHQGHH